MLSRFAAKHAGSSGASRSFSKMLVATESFPIEGDLTPQQSMAPVISENRLANGMKLITKDYNAKMVSLKFSIMGGSGVETEAQKARPSWPPKSSPPYKLRSSSPSPSPSAQTSSQPLLFR
jgi:hypothetical protein